MSVPLSVMIVEDGWDIVRLLSLYLARSGFDTISFTQPLLSLDHFKKYSKRYCLILLDSSMDELNGMELSKEIRKYNSQVKILLITGYCKGDMSLVSTLKSKNLWCNSKGRKLGEIGASHTSTMFQKKAVGGNSKIW